MKESRIPPVVESDDVVAVPMYIGNEKFDVAFLPKGTLEVDLFAIVEEALKGVKGEWIYLPLERLRRSKE